MELSDHNFNRFRDMIYRNVGIHLHEGKKDLVRARLGKRLRRTGCRSFNDYYKMVVGDASGRELVKMLDAVSTNHTSFFREGKHFRFLEDQLPRYPLNGRRELRFWSAGCSSGEEPYSLAIWLEEYLGDWADIGVRILATDISTKVLNQAMRGVYHRKQLGNIPPPLLRKYFQRGFGGQEGYFRVKAHLKSTVEIRHHNLMHPFEGGGGFDFIFCRNVMIYFDKQTRETLVNKFQAELHAGGFLLIGHAESLTGINHSMKYIQPGVYRKAADRGS